MLRNRIKVILAETNRTSIWLAREVGVTESYLSKVTQARANPSTEVCLKICRALNRKVEEVFWLEEPPA